VILEDRRIRKTRTVPLVAETFMELAWMILSSIERMSWSVSQAK